VPLRVSLTRGLSELLTESSVKYELSKIGRGGKLFVKITPDFVSIIALEISVAIIGLYPTRKRKSSFRLGIFWVSSRVEAGSITQDSFITVFPKRICEVLKRDIGLCFKLGNCKILSKIL